jgi:hypothetical protein
MAKSSGGSKSSSSSGKSGSSSSLAGGYFTPKVGGTKQGLLTSVFKPNPSGGGTFVPSTLEGARQQPGSMSDLMSNLGNVGTGNIPVNAIRNPNAGGLEGTGDAQGTKNSNNISPGGAALTAASVGMNPVSSFETGFNVVNRQANLQNLNTTFAAQSQNVLDRARDAVRYKTENKTQRDLADLTAKTQIDAAKIAAAATGQQAQASVEAAKAQAAATVAAAREQARAAQATAQTNLAGNLYGGFVGGILNSGGVNSAYWGGL